MFPVSIISRLIRKYYKDGFTVSDVCSSIKMNYREMLIDHGVTENELYEYVLAYLECNTQIENKNKR